MPNGQAHLMVNLAEDEFRIYDAVRPERMDRHSGAVLAGPHARPTVIDTREQRWLAAVEFRSGGAGRFFSMPMTEVCNRIVQLENLWGRDGTSPPVWAHPAVCRATTLRRGPIGFPVVRSGCKPQSWAWRKNVRLRRFETPPRRASAALVYR